MRRVRHELPLRARRLLERTEHRVEAVREPAELVTAARVDPLRQVAGLRHRLGRLGQPPDGSERRARDDQPEQGRKRDADHGREQQVPADA